ncbi:hypothetical protein ACIHAA_07165 [Streptomyces sp. NPDC052040]|uniref:hypothetical protein n=1 Tax=unclassified Streptomyces TaxID=2593676 RepID=UPI0037D5E7A5
MRVLPARRFACPALCAMLLIGIAGPAAAVADRAPARGRVPAETAPLPPSADVLVRPVTDLLAAVLKADHGRIPADQAARLGKAVDDGIAQVTLASSATKAPVAGEDDAVADLQQATDKLLAAATSDDTGQVAPSATAVVNGLAKVLASGFVSGETLPLPNPSDASALPSLPELPSPKPSASQPPKLSPSQLPKASTSAMPKASGSLMPRAFASPMPKTSGPSMPKSSASQLPRVSGSQLPKSSVSQPPKVSGSLVPKAAPSLLLAPMPSHSTG